MTSITTTLRRFRTVGVSALAVTAMAVGMTTTASAVVNNDPGQPFIIDEDDTTLTAADGATFKTIDDPGNDPKKDRKIHHFYDKSSMRTEIAGELKDSSGCVRIRALFAYSNGGSSRSGFSDPACGNGQSVIVLGTSPFAALVSDVGRHVLQVRIELWSFPDTGTNTKHGVRVLGDPIFVHDAPQSTGNCLTIDTDKANVTSNGVTVWSGPVEWDCESNTNDVVAKLSGRLTWNDQALRSGAQARLKMVVTYAAQHPTSSCLPLELVTEPVFRNGVRGPATRSDMTLNSASPDRAGCDAQRVDLTVQTRDGVAEAWSDATTNGLPSGSKITQFFKLGDYQTA